MTENNDRNGYASVYLDRYREDGGVLQKMLRRVAREMAGHDDFGLADAMVAAAVRVEELDKAVKGGGDALEASYAAHLETTSQLKERTNQSTMLADELIAAYRWIDRFADDHEPGEPSGARDMREEARGMADDMPLADALADADMMVKSGCSDDAVLRMKRAFADAANLGAHGGHPERSVPNLRRQLTQLEADNERLRQRVAEAIIDEKHVIQNEAELELRIDYWQRVAAIHKQAADDALASLTHLDHGTGMSAAKQISHLQISQLSDLLRSPIGEREKSRAVLKKTKADDDIGF